MGILLALLLGASSPCADGKCPTPQQSSVKVVSATSSLDVVMLVARKLFLLLSGTQVVVRCRIFAGEGNERVIEHTFYVLRGDAPCFGIGHVLSLPKHSRFQRENGTFIWARTPYSVHDLGHHRINNGKTTPYSLPDYRDVDFTDIPDGEDVMAAENGYVARLIR